jgi:predicted DCC family thiol-disulfide oxidoreductase YuxK
MPNGWTGGQYALYRALLGVTSASHFGAVGWLAAVPFALGFWDRVIAAAFAGLSAIALLAGHPIDFPGGAAAAALMALHAVTPGRPYGTWAARGRADPGGGWRLPPRVLWCARALVFACLALAATGAVDSLGAAWLPLALLSCDPAWLAPKRDGVPARLFYDGTCGLCHAAVRFVLAEDPEGRGFRFAPLASESFAAVAPESLRNSLPDSIVLALPDRRLLVRAAAAREIGERLGGLWRLFALAARAVPEPLLDRAYDAVARNRKRFVRAPDEACPVVSPELRARFD